MTAPSPSRFIRPILIVEDELFIGLDVADELESRGFTVYGPVSNVKSAAKVVDTYHFAAAILDYRLQDGTSRELAERLMEKNVPVIFYTGNAEEVARDDLASRAIVLAKPASTKHIVTAIEQVAIATA